MTPILLGFRIYWRLAIYLLGTASCPELGVVVGVWTVTGTAGAILARGKLVRIKSALIQTIRPSKAF